MARMTKTQHELQVAVADLSSKEQMMRDKVAASADARRARLKVAEKVKAGKREILMAQLAEVSDPLPSYFATFMIQPSILHQHHSDFLTRFLPLSQKKAQKEYESAKLHAQTTRKMVDKAQVVVTLARQEAEHAAGLAAAEKARDAGGR